MTSRHPAYVALGSNLGDRAAMLALGCRELAELPHTTLRARTTPVDTTPLGGLDQPAYLNQMVLLDTGLDPHTLLQECHRIEALAGRERREQWASRTLDLDLVRYGDTMCDTPTLVLPHPGLRDRLFWAHEIATLESHGH
jgi:2-amino-4-hydroxy-6-hydroxymethyldihydropteridine diphosphokinase